MNLTIDVHSDSGTLMLEGGGETVFSDRPYRYHVSSDTENGLRRDHTLTHMQTEVRDDTIEIVGTFPELGIELIHRLVRTDERIDETIIVANPTGRTVRFSDIGMGFSATLDARRDWRLCAIPFRVQLDGSVHDYTGEDLIEGRFSNAVYSDPTRPEPPLTDAPQVRSEAWAWWNGDAGLVVMKYNSRDIELSVAAPFVSDGEPLLRFGGVGSSLYGEPQAGHSIGPGQSYTFGTTSYRFVEGELEDAFICYRDFLESKGHGFPSDYDPPVNWNELYDVGWYHSRRDGLKANYTRAALLEEAEKATTCGCELLYLDPGWEVAEGLTLWDAERLGPPGEFCSTLAEGHGLGLGFRTILRCNGVPEDKTLPAEYLVQHADGVHDPPSPSGVNLREYCLCNPEFLKLKIDRAHDIVSQGATFLMVDEMDWRGPCFDESHGHPVPTTPIDHARAVYELCAELRRRNPQLIIECHDPIWPWHTAIYVPTYFAQGFGDAGSYDENWGFEYMWDCINDLKSGKALVLYYYNLGCSIPLYLHITMAADNDNCLFFWWAASTIRHLGIGGKYGHPTVNPEGMKPHDPDMRFALYREHMELYQSLKPWFVRGEFHGLSETAHLHTLPDRAGGVLVVFNLAEATAQTITMDVPRSLIGTASGESVVSGAKARWSEFACEIEVVVPPESAKVVMIGISSERVI